MRENRDKLQVDIPNDLIEFLQCVNIDIITGEDSAVIPSDDLLQCDRGYGGLNSDRRQFSFVFFPYEGMRVRWEFSLLPDEIDEIASGFREKLHVNQFTKEE